MQPRESKQGKPQDVEGLFYCHFFVHLLCSCASSPVAPGLKISAAGQCHPYSLRGTPQGSQDVARVVSLGPQSPHSTKWLDPGNFLQESSNCTWNLDDH